MPELILRRESWPIRGTFTISRGSKTAAEVVVAELHENGPGPAAANAFPTHAMARPSTK